MQQVYLGIACLMCREKERKGRHALSVKSSAGRWHGSLSLVFLGKGQSQPRGEF